jgi:hypothetical protein
MSVMITVSGTPEHAGWALQRICFHMHAQHGKAM